MVRWTYKNDNIEPAGWYIYLTFDPADPESWPKLHETVEWRRWCKENLTYMYEITFLHIYISNIEDFVFFQLNWLT